MPLISLSSVHTQALFLVCSGKRDGKTEGLISRSFEDCTPHSVLFDNFTNHLECGRTEVMGTILQEYLVGEVHFQGTEEFLSCRGFSGVHAVVQADRREFTPCAIVYVAGSRL